MSTSRFEETDWRNNPPFTIEEVYSVCGGKLERARMGADKIGPVPCPVCGKPKKMYLFTASNTAYCHVCGRKWSMLELATDVLGYQDKKEACKAILSALGRDTWDEAAKSDYQQKREKIQKQREEQAAKASPMLPVEERDRTYRAMLDEMQLMDVHYRDLFGRGFTPGAIKALGYKSISRIPSNATVCERLLLKGCSLDGVPGFYRENGKHVMYDRVSGYLIPYRDRIGRIQDFQIRTAGDPKYIWWSTGEKESGCPAEVFVHYAVDRIDGRIVLPVNPRTKKMWIGITEGALKADLAHFVTGIPFIAISGVACQQYLGEEFAFLKSIGCEEIVDFFDMDYIGNVHVEDAMKKLKQKVLDAGLSYAKAKWLGADGQMLVSSKGQTLKGVDDFFVAKMRGELPR